MLTVWTKKLSSQAEFLIVVLVAFGLPIAMSLFFMLHPGADRQFVWSQGLAFSLVLEELVVLVLVVLFLRFRGWKRKDIDLEISWRLTGGGLVLLIAAYLLMIVLGMLLSPIGSWIFNTTIQVSAVTLPVYSIVLMSLVNAVYEEVLVAGYVVSVIRRDQPVWIAILVSAMIRSLHYTYLGPFAVLAMLCMGILFAYAYHRWKSLWPLIVAHALLDLFGLLAHRSAV